MCLAVPGQIISVEKDLWGSVGEFLFRARDAAT